MSEAEIYEQWRDAAMAGTYTELPQERIVEAFMFSGRYGPPNCWTGTLGTAAAMIRELLREREQLLASVAYHTSEGGR